MRDDLILGTSFSGSDWENRALLLTSNETGAHLEGRKTHRVHYVATKPVASGKARFIVYPCEDAERDARVNGLDTVACRQ